MTYALVTGARVPAAENWHRFGTDTYGFLRFTRGMEHERESAAAVAGALDVSGLEAVACPMCIFGVACGLDSDDERESRRALQFFMPLLWDEGLGGPVRAALEAAREAEVADAGAAIADLDARGPRSFVFGAVVRRLAERQSAAMKRSYITSRN